ncbi:MAG: hypothetical protein IJT66_00405, partial [Clostridia bacterium]|nr:hypothetical protein [Clostridia bacterium]
MKKITAILLSLMLAASMFSVAFTVVATDDGIDWERYLALSDDAELDEEASSIQAGQVTFKVTLPVEGYAQFQQPLRSLISYDSLNNAEKVTIVVGDGTKAEYNYSMLQVQLVGSADASTDIVPVDEANGEDPGTQALTWHLYGPQDLNDPIVSTAYGLNKGCSTRSGAQFTHFSNIENHHLQLLFTEETDGHVTVSQPYGAQYPNNYAYRKCASTYTLDDLNAEDGVYFRIRNNDPDAEITYTVTIQSADVTTAYRDGDFILTEGSSLANSSVSASDGKTNYTFTSTLAPEGYIQFDKKLTDLADDAIAVQVVVGNGTASDYEMTNVNVQLTADATGAQNINLVNELNSTPDTTGMTWIFQNYNNAIRFNTGGYLGGATDLATPENTENTGLRVRFTKDEDDYVVGTYIGIANKARASKRTLTEIGGDDGVYVRIRNNASQEITYTVTVTVASQ